MSFKLFKERREYPHSFFVVAVYSYFSCINVETVRGKGTKAHRIFVSFTHKTDSLSVTLRKKSSVIPISLI